jgi:hypothetical protein
VLRRELARRSWTRETVALGTNTDPYQRAEGRYALMPGIIGALSDSGTPFSILTKGTLLRRDLLLIAAAAARVDVSVAVSLAIGDPELHRLVEPGTPTPEARLGLIRSVRDAGLDCHVMVAPVLPLLTDSVAHLDGLLGRIAAMGATGVTVFGLPCAAHAWLVHGVADATYPELVGSTESCTGAVHICRRTTATRCARASLRCSPARPRARQSSVRDARAPAVQSAAAQPTVLTFRKMSYRLPHLPLGPDLFGGYRGEHHVIVDRASAQQADVAHVVLMKSPRQSVALLRHQIQAASDVARRQVEEGFRAVTLLASGSPRHTRGDPCGRAAGTRIAQPGRP